jgi:hypothetical protein
MAAWGVHSDESAGKTYSWQKIQRTRRGFYDLWRAPLIIAPCGVGEIDGGVPPNTEAKLLIAVQPCADWARLREIGTFLDPEGLP